MKTTPKNFIYNNKICGQILETPQFIVFWGHSHLKLNNIKSLFKDFDFHTLHQVHGIDTVPQPQNLEKEIKADAHYTKKKNQALCIKTADCLPILLFDNHTILAIHAGWRGLNDLIIPNAIKGAQLNPTETIAFIGPSISKNSFEVGTDVSSDLAKVSDNEVQPINHPSSEKKYFDLKKLAQYQMQKSNICSEDIFISNIDTFTDNNYPSYRKDKTNERMISFIVML